MRSDALKQGAERAPHRSLLRALGCTDRDLERPFIGVINSYNEIIPGHAHLDRVAAAVKAGVRSAGGTPFESSVVSMCDGLAMNHNGMHFSLPSRELVADSVEVLAQSHAFDALVLIPNCDKIVPGMLMAAARLDLPTVFVSGGPMLAGRLGDRSLDLSSVFVAVGAYARGQISAGELDAIERTCCPGLGSCAGMFTANTMNCLTEALGLGLPGNGTALAVSASRLRLAEEAGVRVMDVLAKGVTARQVLTKAALHNAIIVDMALGGSSNTVLHLLAIAHEAGVELSLAEIDSLGRRTPQLCSLSPVGSHHIEDLDHAGGIPALMSALARDGRLDLDALTVLGRLGNVLDYAAVPDARIIRPLAKPYSPTGSLAILWGNLAPDGAVVKAAAVAPSMHQHRGPARVFESEEEATRAILAGQFAMGDVLVIRNEGPRGGPGMREMLTPTSLLCGMGVDEQVALITDGRYSGATRGAAIGHISPEAAARGPIAAVRDGDVVHIDIPNRRIELEVAAPELAARLAGLPAWQPRISTGYLRRYAEMVTSASTGAILVS